MTDDLVKRLRYCAPERRDCSRNELAMLDAADRIEKLEAALRRWPDYGCPDCGGDCFSANPPVSCCIMMETREALEVKDE